jgi:hypothetical protein
VQRIQQESRMCFSCEKTCCLELCEVFRHASSHKTQPNCSLIFQYRGRQFSWITRGRRLSSATDVTGIHCLLKIFPSVWTNFWAVVFFIVTFWYFRESGLQIKIFTHFLIDRSQVSSVSIAMGYRQDGPGLIPCSARFFSSPQCPGWL